MQGIRLGFTSSIKKLPLILGLGFAISAPLSNAAEPNTVLNLYSVPPLS